MMFSDLSLKLYCAVKQGVIKNRNEFWRNCNSEKKILSLDLDTDTYINELKASGISLVCAFDSEFPEISPEIKTTEKPFLFTYQGDLSLLSDISRNVAVIGTLTPTEQITEREKKFVRKLTEKGLNIISGLAKGCDTIAHETCLSCGGKTIAFLPSTLSSIYPKSNVKLAKEIVERGGLIITEYITEPHNRYESIKRFIDRDRLQAMFSSAVILTASNITGKGDSGSRYAMDKAFKYNRKRRVMYNEKTDSNNPLFEMNKEYINKGAEILTAASVNNLCTTSSI
ncbi:MAG: DNA-processing protein DprA [Christensenellaceae bacterium]